MWRNQFFIYFFLFLLTKLYSFLRNSNCYLVHKKVNNCCHEMQSLEKYKSKQQKDSILAIWGFKLKTVSKKRKERNTLFLIQLSCETDGYFSFKKKRTKNQSVNKHIRVSRTCLQNNVNLTTFRWQSSDLITNRHGVIILFPGLLGTAKFKDHHRFSLGYTLTPRCLKDSRRKVILREGNVICC